MCFVTRNAKLSKFINNENFCKKEKKEIDRSRDVTGMVDNMHSNLTHHKIAKCRVANGTESNGINSIFANKGNCGKIFGASLCYLKYSSHIFKKANFEQYLLKIFCNSK